MVTVDGRGRAKSGMLDVSMSVSVLVILEDEGIKARLPYSLG